ncbi:MAG: hypothetical protein AAGA31_12645, partial [Bacteroidota bacterium]
SRGATNPEQNLASSFKNILTDADVAVAQAAAQDSLAGKTMAFVRINLGFDATSDARSQTVPYRENLAALFDRVWEDNSRVILFAARAYRQSVAFKRGTYRARQQFQNFLKSAKQSLAKKKRRPRSTRLWRILISSS